MARAKHADVDDLIPDVFERACESRHLLADVMTKWGVLVLAALYEGTFRFNALRRKVDGVSEKMLAQTLQTLQRDDLVERDVQETIPPRVEYTLTPRGHRIAAKLQELIDVFEDEVANGRRK